MPRVAVIGGGGHARVCASIARRDRLFDLHGYVDPIDRGSLDGLAYLGTDEEFLQRHPKSDLLLGVGLMRNAGTRWRLYSTYRASGCSFVALVSSRASVAAEARLGAGTVVFDQAVVNPGAELGQGCIINSGAVLEHDCRLGDNVHLAPHATVCGEVWIGDHCLIGAGATVIPGVRIPEGCIIGAGAVVTAGITEPGTYLGVPAVRRGEGMRT